MALALFLAFVLGMRHATEPDHMAALTTMADRSLDWRAGLRLGFSWGLGHAVSLLAFALGVATVGARLPETFTSVAELTASTLLVALALRSIYLAHHQATHGIATSHAHRGRWHKHAHASAHVHLGSLALARRALVIGAIHGVGGSGALTIWILTNLRGAAPRVAYALAFATGSILSMMLLALAGGWLWSKLGERGALRLRFATAFASLVIGGAWGFSHLTFFLG